MKTAAAARLAVFFLVALTIFWRLGTTPLNETDEGFTANRAGSMLRHHTFWVSYDDVGLSEPQFRKPPLWYWIVAACYRLLGYNVWAVRIPTAIASLICIYLFYRIHRSAFDERVALAGAALCCAVPFLLLHMKTAMLEIPILLVGLSAMWIFARQRGIWPSLAAGLLCGAAFLIKGTAGFVTLGLVLAFGLAVRPMGRDFLIDALAATAGTIIPALIYFICLPAPYRADAIHAFFVNEAVNRITSKDLAVRMWMTGRNIFENLRWILVAAFFGLVICMGRVRERPIREWLFLGLVICVPVFLIGSREQMPYARYFIPIYFFAVALASLFCFEVLQNRRANGLLIPFAMASFFVEDSWLKWLPIIAAIGVFLIFRIRSAERRAFSSALTVVLGMSIITSTVQSAVLQQNIALELQHNNAEVIPLAQRASSLLKDDDRLIVGHGFKCHAAVFYSRRPVIGVTDWLITELVPGSRRFGIFRKEDVSSLPIIHSTLIDSAGAMRLYELDVPDDLHGVSAIVAWNESVRGSMETLGLAGIPFGQNGDFILVSNAVPLAETEILPTAYQIIQTGIEKHIGKGSFITVEFEKPMPLCGVVIMPLNRKQPLRDLQVQILNPDGSWHVLSSVKNELNPLLGLKDGRLSRLHKPEVRFRFLPIETTCVRIMKPHGLSTEVSALKLYVTMSEP